MGKIYLGDKELSCVEALTTDIDDTSTSAVTTYSSNKISDCFDQKGLPRINLMCLGLCNCNCCNYTSACLACAIYNCYHDKYVLNEGFLLYNNYWYYARGFCVDGYPTTAATGVAAVWGNPNNYGTGYFTWLWSTPGNAVYSTFCLNGNEAGVASNVGYSTRKLVLS